MLIYNTTTSNISHTSLQYHIDKQIQEQTLARQQAMLDHLFSRRLKYDGVVDVSIALFR